MQHSGQFLYCGYLKLEDKESKRQDEIENDVLNPDFVKTIDELDPVQNQINSQNIIKFLSDYDETFMDRKRPKGLDYLVIDNFAENFGLN